MYNLADIALDVDMIIMDSPQDVVTTQPFAINWLRAINKYWDKPYSAAYFILSLMSCQFHIMEHGQHFKLNIDTDGQVT